MTALSAARPHSSFPFLVLPKKALSVPTEQKKNNATLSTNFAPASEVPPDVSTVAEDGHYVLFEDNIIGN